MQERLVFRAVGPGLMNITNYFIYLKELCFIGIGHASYARVEYCRLDIHRGCSQIFVAMLFCR